MPEPGDPQSLNRYSYVLNNPLKYGDPTGHCPVCVSALFGAIAGGVLAYGVQVYDNLSNNNMGLIQALTTDINTQEIIVGATVGGFAGLTMGLGTAVLGSGAGATLVSGAASGSVGGRINTLAEATLIEYDQWKNGQSIEIRQLWDEALVNGLFDTNKMIIDTGTGAISAGVGKAFGAFLQKAGWVEFYSNKTTSRSPITIKGFLPGGRGVWLDTGRGTIELPLETWQKLINAFQAGNVELAQELLSGITDITVDEVIEAVNP